MCQQKIYGELGIEGHDKERIGREVESEGHGRCIARLCETVYEPREPGVCCREQPKSKTVLSISYEATSGANRKRVASAIEEMRKACRHNTAIHSAQIMSTYLGVVSGAGTKTT